MMNAQPINHVSCETIYIDDTDDEELGQVNNQDDDMMEVDVISVKKNDDSTLQSSSHLGESNSLPPPSEKVWHSLSDSALKFSTIGDLITALSCRPSAVLDDTSIPSPSVNSTIDIIRYYITTRTGKNAETFVAYLKSLFTINLDLDLLLPIYPQSLDRLLKVPRILIRSIPLVISDSVVTNKMFHSIQFNPTRYRAVIVTNSITTTTNLTSQTALPNLYIMQLPPLTNLYHFATIPNDTNSPTVQLVQWCYDNYAYSMLNSQPSWPDASQLGVPPHDIESNERLLDNNVLSKTAFERLDYTASELVMLLTNWHHLDIPFVIFVSPLHHNLHNLGPIIESRFRMVLQVETADEFMFIHQFLSVWCTDPPDSPSI